MNLETRRPGMDQKGGRRLGLERIKNWARTISQESRNRGTGFSRWEVKLRGSESELGSE